MDKILSPEIQLYLEILVTLVLAVAAGFLVFVLRRAVKGAGVTSKTPGGFFLARLILPFVLLLLALVMRLGALRAALPLGERYFAAIDAAFVFFVVFFLVRLLDASLRAWYLRKGRPFPVPRVLHGFILVVIYLAVVFIILKQVLMIDITPFLATSAILTAVLGLALQGVLGNILAGMSLHFTRAFERGDWIRVGEVEGVVMDTNWRETRILDRASNMIVFPNTIVASQVVTNFSMPDRKSAVTMAVKAGFSASPTRVFKILKEAAGEIPEVEKTPAPLAYLLSYDEFGVSYLAKFWISDYSRKYSILAAVGRLIWYKFRREGIEIPVAVEEKVGRVLKSVKGDEAVSLLRALEEKNAEDIQGSSFLRIQEGEKAGEILLAEAEVRELASRIVRERFTAGEVLFKQGEKGESCYLVARGKVKGEIAYEEKGKRYTSEFEIGAGGIVGEMSLFTGMPRTATVQVVEEAELLEIRAEAFAALIGRNPRLAEVVAEVVSGRNKQNLEFLQKIKELSAKDVENITNKKSVLEYLKKLVHLFKK